MPDRITNNVNPTQNEVRQWGYDDDLYLTSQDEDLLLYGLEYVPVLLELAGDELCPKQYFALCILGQFSREAALYKHTEDIQGLKIILDSATKADDPDVFDWQKCMHRLIAYQNQPFEVNEEQAWLMAQDLLVGIGRRGKVNKIEKEVTGDWHFVLKTSLTEHLYINEKTGAYCYERT